MTGRLAGRGGTHPQVAGRLERTAAAKATKTRNHQRQTCSHMQFTKVYGLAGLSG